MAKTPAWQRKEGKSESGGLNKKGVASYRAANPGSKLRTAEIIEQMVAEEQEMMDNIVNDPLVDLKQQEIDLRKEDLELKAQAMGEKQALDEKKLMQTDKLAREKIESQEDIAQLRANVALDKADKDRDTKKK